MNLKPLIEQLSSNLTPTQTMKSRSSSFVSILFVSILSGMALLGICGPRTNLALMAHKAGFYSELCLLFLATILSFRWASLSSVPGILQRPQLKVGMLSGIALALVILFTQHSGSLPKDNEWLSFIKSGSHCSLLISICALIPGAWSYREAKQGACTRPQLSLALILVGSFSAAILVQHLICPSDELWHLLVWHLGLIPIVVISAFALGRQALKL